MTLSHAQMKRVHIFRAVRKKNNVISYNGKSAVSKKACSATVVQNWP